MGWLDNDGNLNNQTVTEDVMNLPEEVSALVSHEGIAQCINDTMAEMEEEPIFKRCADKYTEEELELLEEVGSMVAGFKCFQDRFYQGCNDVIRNQISSLTSTAVTEPSGRSFQRLSCLHSCQAVNFAATTSCTFGGFFFTFTRTCNQVFPLLALG